MLRRLAVPRIGVGYGGLSWKKERAIVEAVFGGWPGTLVVYEEFVPGAAEQPEPKEPPSSARTSDAGEASAAPGLRKKSARPRRATFDPGTATMETVIRFYSVGEDYGCFSNFSPHPIKVKGETWPTGEHYFQAQKFAGTPDEEEVRLAKSPMIAARMGRSRKRPLRKDWEGVKDRIMHEAVLAKFTQHTDLREILLGTSDAKIVEHTENDSYWGDGGDGVGKNMLGKILMRVREELRST